MNNKKSEKINERDRRAYEQSGYHVVSGYLTASKLKEIENWIDEISFCANTFPSVEIYLEDPCDPESDIRRMESVCAEHRNYIDFSQELAYQAGALLGEQVFLKQYYSND